jgi:hypothetical protein
MLAQPALAVLLGSRRPSHRVIRGPLFAALMEPAQRIADGGRVISAGANPGPWQGPPENCSECRLYEFRRFAGLMRRTNYAKRNHGPHSPPHCSL